MKMNLNEKSNSNDLANQKTRLLFIDRDGTVTKELPPTYQLDSFEKLKFYPGVFEYLTKIATEFNYELVVGNKPGRIGNRILPRKYFFGRSITL
jgi:imidazoleglycerol-phosphate dehydratase/histidinol-phosphatase